MKIIKVIVDEVPESCFECVFEAIEMCSLMYEELDSTRYDHRPNWCPLIKKEQSVKAVLCDICGNTMKIESEQQ